MAVALQDQVETNRLARAKVLVLVAAFLGWMFDGLEMGIFPLIARPAMLDLFTRQGSSAEAAAKLASSWMGLVTALFLLGAAGGGLLFGWLGDRIGRVRAMTLSILTYSLVTGLGYFVTAPWQLGAVRFISALGMGGEWALGVALVMEVWPAKHRFWLAGVIGAASNVGFALTGLLGALRPVTIQSWRWVMLAGAAPALLTLVIRLFVPESERWRDAVKEKAAAPVRELLTRTHIGRLAIGTLLSTVALIGTWGATQWLPTWADQLTTESSAKAKVQIVSALGAVVGCVLGSLLARAIGRRWSYFALAALSLAVCQAMFGWITSYSWLFLLMSFIAGVTTASFYGWLPLYLPELFPTRVRATGQGIAFNFGRILTAAAAIGAGHMAAAQPSGNFAPAGAIITLVYILGLAAIWLAPETQGRTLE
jgi:MFS family permease